MAAVPSIGRASLVEAPRVAPQAAATEGLYERHAAKIQSYCHHQLGSREEAEDAVQTTFMNAFRALGRGVVPEAESAWLFKIAENVCLSRRRSSWRRGRIESPSDFEVIEEVVPGPSRQRDELIGIEDALASMPEQQRRAILLREWQGLSYREIAAELEVSQSAVETLIFRARRSLAQGLEQPDTIKPKRKSFRRAMHMIDLGTIAVALKTLLAGSAAVKATAAAVAVTAAVGTVATVTPTQDARTPAKVPAAPAVKSASLPGSTISSAPSARTGEPAADLATATAPAPEPKPARAKASRTAPARAVPAAAPAETPQAVPVQPAQEPASAPVADQPKQDEPKHEATPPAAEGKKNEGARDEGGKQGRGAQATPAPAEPADQPAASAPEPSSSKLSGNSKGRGNDKAKDAQVEAPLPVVATAPAVVEDSKKERGRGNGKRELTSVATDALAPTPVVEASEPVSEPAVEAAAVVTEAQPTVAVEAGDTGNGNGKGKGK